MCECYEKVKNRTEERVLSSLPKGSGNVEVFIESYGAQYLAEGGATNALRLEFFAYYSAPDGKKSSRHGYFVPLYCPFCGENIKGAE